MDVPLPLGAVLSTGPEETLAEDLMAFFDSARLHFRKLGGKNCHDISSGFEQGDLRLAGTGIAVARWVQVVVWAFSVAQIVEEFASDPLLHWERLKDDAMGQAVKALNDHDGEVTAFGLLAQVSEHTFHTAFRTP